MQNATVCDDEVSVDFLDYVNFVSSVLISVRVGRCLLIITPRSEILSLDKVPVEKYEIVPPVSTD